MTFLYLFLAMFCLGKQSLSPKLFENAISKQNLAQGFAKACMQKANSLSYTG